MDAAFEKRAARRRLVMQGGVAQSFAELDRAGQAFVERATLAERLSATSRMLVEAWVIQGKDGPPPRFDGSTYGVLKFER